MFKKRHIILTVSRFLKYIIELELFDSNHLNWYPYKLQNIINVKLELEIHKNCFDIYTHKCEYLNATNRDQKDNIFATNNWYLGYDKCT